MVRMGHLYTPLPCCGDERAPRPVKGLVFVREEQDLGTVLVECGECESRFMRGITPREVALLIELGTTLKINMDVNDPEIREAALRETSREIGDIDVEMYIMFSYRDREITAETPAGYYYELLAQRRVERELGDFKNV